jgi:hypothetical protein
MFVLFLSDAVSEQEDTAWPERPQNSKLKTFELPKLAVELLELLSIADDTEIGEALEEGKQLGSIAVRLSQKEVSSGHAATRVRRPNHTKPLAVNRDWIIHTSRT